MEKYETLLKKALEKIPKRVSTEERFQIPEPIAEIQGPKTLVKNFNEIAKVLRREPSHLAKFLFKELATPGNIQGDILILQAKVGTTILKKKIDDYTKGFVYCKVCGEPDTRLVKEHRILAIVCEACGARSPAKRM